MPKQVAKVRYVHYAHAPSPFQETYYLRQPQWARVFVIKTCIVIRDVPPPVYIGTINRYCRPYKFCLACVCAKLDSHPIPHQAGERTDSAASRGGRRRHTKLAQSNGDKAKPERNAFTFTTRRDRKLASSQAKREEDFLCQLQPRFTFPPMPEILFSRPHTKAPLAADTDTHSRLTL